MRSDARFGEIQRCDAFFSIPGHGRDSPYPCWKLPPTYDEIINHPSTSDEMRRSTEAKLFRYRLKYLKALPIDDPEKEAIFILVHEMMRGMILLEIPDELVWTQWLESKNVRRIGKLSFWYPRFGY